MKKFLKNITPNIFFDAENQWSFDVFQFLTDTVNFDIPDMDHTLYAEKNHWRSCEKIWYGSIPKEKMFLNHGNEIYFTFLYEFFNNGNHYQDVSKNHKWDTGNENWLEHFPKLVWLTNEYMTSEKSFKNAVCSHWNPRAGLINVHPGGTRQVVLNLFSEKTIPAFFFNTGGYYERWMDSLKLVDVEKLVTKTTWAGGVVADHGTFIPHLIRDTQLIPDGKAKWFNRTRDKYIKGWKIFFDVNDEKFDGLLGFINEFRTYDREKSDVIIKFPDKFYESDNNNDTRLITKGIVAAFAEIDLREEGVLVDHKFTPTPLSNDKII